MQNVQLLSVIDKIRNKYLLYERRAYFFIYNTVNFTIKKLQLSQSQHITAQDLLQGFRDLAKTSFGCMALEVLDVWGIKNCQDICQIVHHLVEFNVLRRNSSDDYNDFIRHQFDFKKYF